MGKGNIQKAAIARARNMASAQAEGKKTTKEDMIKHQKAATAYKCTVCLQTFGNTTRQGELQQHVDSKHSKLNKTLCECFPDFVMPE